LVPPFDHLDVIAGRGPPRWEMFEELKSLDVIVTPCGGGGLLGGTAAATKHLDPQCRVIGIEPELGDDAAVLFAAKRSRRSRTRRRLPTGRARRH